MTRRVCVRAVGVSATIAVLIAGWSSALRAAGPGVHMRISKQALTNGAEAFCSQPHLSTTRDHRVRLTVQDADLKPGEGLFARIENRSANRVRYQAPFSIERFDREEWIPDAVSPKGPWPRYLGVLPPSATSRCFLFDVPIDIEPRRYRISKTVEMGTSQSRELRKIVALFRIRQHRTS